jgi:hypothetical protein
MNILDSIKFTFQLYKEVKQEASLNSESDESIAYQRLMSKLSYRLNSDANSDPMIGLRMTKRLFVDRGKRDQKIHSEIRSGIAILDGNSKKYELRIEYISQFLDPASIFLFKEANGYLGHWSVQEKLFYLIRIAGIVFKCGLSKTNRANRALIICEFVELTNIISILTDNQVKVVYDFGAFEKDSDFLTLALRRVGIRHVKLPSPGPIALHYNPSLCDELLINTPYQMEEVNYFQTTIRVKKVDFIPPEYFFRLKNDISLNHKVEPGVGIGFYSHGSWVRKNDNHNESAMEIGKSELALLDILKTLQSKTNVNTVIFCHPREKMTTRKLREAFYNDTLNPESYSFSDFQRSSSSQFALVEFGLCAYSSIIYERLFCGFKTFIYIPNHGENIASVPLSSSNLNNICFGSLDELETLIQRNQKFSRREFFINNQLEGYAYWDFDL